MCSDFHKIETEMWKVLPGNGPQSPQPDEQVAPGAQQDRLIACLLDVGAVGQGFLSPTLLVTCLLFKVILLIEYTRLSASIVEAGNDSYLSGKTHLVLSHAGW